MGRKNDKAVAYGNAAYGKYYLETEYYPDGDGNTARNAGTAQISVT